MNYDLTGIRNEVYCETLETSFEDLSFEQLVDMCAYDTAMEGKVVDFIKSSLSNIKKFIVKAFNFIKSAITRLKPIGAKIAKFMVFIKNKLMTILSRIKFRKKEGVATEDIDASNKNMQKLLAILNRHIGIIMAQDVLAYKLIHTGILKRQGVMNAGFLTFLGAIAVLGIVYLQPVVILTGLLTGGVWAFCQNWFSPKLLKINFKNNLEPIIRANKIAELEKRIKPYRNDVIGTDDAINNVIERVLAVKDWISFGDLRPNITGGNIDASTIKNIDEAYDKASERLIADIKNCAKESADDKAYIDVGQKELFKNMDICTNNAESIASVSNMILKNVSATYKEIKSLDFKKEWDDLHPDIQYVVCYNI